MKKLSIIALAMLFAGLSSSIQAWDDVNINFWRCRGDSKKYRSFQAAQRSCNKPQRWEREEETDTNSGLLHGGGILGTGIGKHKTRTERRVN
jgi:hypothetical protein